MPAVSRFQEVSARKKGSRTPLLEGFGNAGTIVISIATSSGVDLRRRRTRSPYLRALSTRLATNRRRDNGSPSINTDSPPAPVT
jgi:hypothetical protein